jgi:hypothetical protein
MFSSSAAANLRRALAQQDRFDLVVHLHDNFSFGPIDGAGREHWADEVLGITNWHDITAGTAPFLEASCSSSIEPVAWFSRRDTQSHAGFLWWLGQRGDAPCRVMDITDLRITYNGVGDPYLAVSPSLLSPADMGNLIDSHAPLENGHRAQHQAQWRALAADNAPLRVLDEQGSLASAPITHFDDLLLSCATIGWCKMSLIIGQSLARSRKGDLAQVGDLILHSRLCELAESGVLEWRGDLHNVQKCELRLPG